MLFTNGQVWYASLSDVRWDGGAMIFRTAKNYTDYRGGSNFNTTVEDIDEDLARYIK